jgi:hypothetical protein
MHRRKVELQREVSNLANVVAQGDFSLALRTALEGLPDSLCVKISNIRSFCRAPHAGTFGLSSILTRRRRVPSLQSTSIKSG